MLPKGIFGLYDAKLFFKGMSSFNFCMFFPGFPTFHRLSSLIFFLHWVFSVSSIKIFSGF